MNRLSADHSDFQRRGELADEEAAERLDAEHPEEGRVSRDPDRIRRRRFEVAA